MDTSPSRQSVIRAMSWDERTVTVGAKKLTRYTRLPYWLHAKVRDSLLRSSGGVCIYCDDLVQTIGGEGKFATIDHRVPLSRGGTWKRYNLGIACRACNTEKGDLTEDEFRRAKAAEIEVRERR